MKYIFFFILFIYCFSRNASADPVKIVRLHEEEGRYPLGMKVEVLDPGMSAAEGPFSFEEVSGPAFDSLFYPNEGSFIIFNDLNEDHWVRFKVKNRTGNSASEWILESDQWYCSVEMFVVYPDGRVSRQKANTTSQIIDDAHVVLKPDLPPRQEADVYLNLSGNKQYLTIWEKGAFYSYARRRDMLYSAFLAVFLVMILYNLFLFFSVKDYSYLWYSLYCAGFILLQNTLTGFGAQFLWPDYPWVNGMSIELLAFTSFFGFLAARSFLNLKNSSAALNRFFNVLLLVSGFLMAGSFLQLPFISLKILLITSALMSVALFVTALIVCRKGYTPARYYLAGWSFLLISVVIYSLSVIGWIPVSFFTIHVVKVCSVIEVVLLSLGLADRINVSRREEERAQEKVITVLEEKEKVTESANISLEQKARELETAYHALLESKGESARLQELDQVKSQFFANISHEFRTPLTIILGQTEQFMKELPAGEKGRKEYELIYRNASRLLQLINQLLDLAKLEAGGMRLQAEKTDLKTFLQVFVSSFSSLAEAKEIKLLFCPEEGVPAAYVDRDKFEKITGNLLSNALKFTPAGGVVRVSLSKASGTETSLHNSSGYIKLEVRDTGNGICREMLGQVFDRFFQEDNSLNRAYNGTGIGLALVKELVKSMHGEIYVESEKGVGACFTILLPLGKAHLKDEEIIHIPSGAGRQDVCSFFPEQHLPSESETSENSGVSAERKEQPLLLVVEDNQDVRSFIRTLFAASYNILEAENGEQGFHMAMKHAPDIIVSDLMMPVMDGFTLCEKLKKDPLTSHIPVLLVTARANSECRIEGLETGADDYVVKPFKAQELRARVNNLTAGRRRLRKHFSKDIFVKPKDITVNSVDEQFLERLREVLEKNLEDTAFTTEHLASELNMSRSQLHRKLTALVNQSATEFMRRFRLQRAGQLLIANNGNVADIAYRTGFNNLSYFSKCFRELYGMTPSEYAENKRVPKRVSKAVSEVL